MESDLISRKALLEDLRESINWLHKIYGGLEYEDEKRICSAEIATFTEVGMRVKDAPAVDAVEVVRCEKCMYRWKYLMCPMFFYCQETGKARDFTRDNGFCHKGVKKDAVD